MTDVSPALAVWLLVAAAVLVVVAATLAAAEAAVGRLTRAEAARLVAEGRRGASAVQDLVTDPSQALSVSTLARVTAETAAAVCVAVAAEALTDSWWAGLLIAVVVMGVVSFVLLGVSPRTVGRQHAEGVALRAAPRLRLLARLLGPIARLLVLVGNAITPGKGYRDGPFASEGELRELVDRASESSIIEAGERQMIHSVFELGDTLVREVMSPRTDMVTLPARASLREAMTTFLSSGRSRVPVVGESVDDVVGVLFFKDVARALLDRRGGATRAGDLARPAVFVPETKQVDTLLREMQHDSLHLAVVVDEYGGVAGLVTLEDLLEEIVGEIADEYDREPPEVVPLGDGAFRVNARLPIDELGELFGIDVEDDEVDSVGGLLAKVLGTVPDEGARVRVAGLELTAEAVDGHRITTVLARRADEEAHSAPAEDGAIGAVPAREAAS
ncbi:hemolysin family protein [Quadrisphaera sp. DSM 44207]|uniref:hemolysin family protein n=1 Tax=Quadrisphaera sp. DSM 44207 TaxID=1881057 RepID=UPI00088AC7FB|nr:hemolysin family protein [Quadrisphaera sp. DSM 44207]SDQ04684.1 Hemolysin, contains CBS domains [Quadrisphaera sp. DSM 44207]